MQALIENIKNSGLSTKILSKRSGLEVGRIESIVNGSEPSMNEVRKLSKALKVTSDFLLTTADRYSEVNVLYRQSYKRQADHYKINKIAYLVGNALDLLKSRSFKEPNLNQFPLVDNTFENARLLAGIFRQIYCNGDFIEPFLHLPRIVTEDFGCILFITDLGNDTDGASAIIEKIPFIFIAPRFEPRMLFTLAHELAHIISHLKRDDNFINIDGNVESPKRNFIDEAFANAFASELLLPEEGVGRALQIIRKSLNVISDRPLGDIEIIYLSRLYGVSFDVAAKRCEDLHLLPKGGAASISHELKQEYGTAEKRAEELNIRERPKIIFPKVSPLLLDAAIDKINSGDLSLGKASEILSIPMAEILNRKSNA